MGRKAGLQGSWEACRGGAEQLERRGEHVSRRVEKSGGVGAVVWPAS